MRMTPIFSGISFRQIRKNIGGETEKKTKLINKDQPSTHVLILTDLGASRHGLRCFKLHETSFTIVLT